MNTIKGHNRPNITVWSNDDHDPLLREIGQNSMIHHD